MKHRDQLPPHRLAAYNKVREVLRRWDPIRVICDENQSEYDSYEWDFASRLDKQMPVDQIVEFMRRLALDYMGSSSFDEAHARACATELTEFWRTWNDG